MSELPPEIGAAPSSRDDLPRTPDSRDYAARVVLVGDIHMYQLTVAPWRLMGKRFLGLANLWLRRRRHFDHALLPAFTPRICTLRPDWMLLSGDVTTTSLEEEFRRAASWLHSGPMASMSKIMTPGNHDRYTQGSVWRQTVERWMGEWLPPHFPGWQDIGGRWSVLTLDAARPRFFSSRGEVDRRQLEEAHELIEGMPRGRGLIVLCHYPYAVPPGVLWRPGHQLAHRHRVEELVRTAGQRASQVIYLHGHLHQPWVWRPDPGEGAPVTVVNAGSPCCKGKEFPGGQGFWQIDLPHDPADTVKFVRHVPVMGRKGLIWKRVEEQASALSVAQPLPSDA